MSEGSIKSKAFRRAALKSESYRVIGLLSILSGLMLFVIARGLATGERRLLAVQLLVLIIVIAHEVVMLRSLKAALRSEREIPSARWVFNVLIESQLPTIALLILIAIGAMNPYTALVTPVVMVYFLFIILSTLRLNPGITVMTGLLSALGYLVVALYVETTFQNSRVELAAFPLRVYFVYAFLIFAGGIVGAVVAGQVKRHVAAALREAELKSELERVTHDLDIARSIQQGLLPSTQPVLNQFEIAGWNQAADQTGGDYYDWQELPDGRLAISLADATGHGIGPALVGTSCRAYARASFLSGGGDDGVLDHLNRLLAEDLSANRFVTFAVILLDPATSRVKVLSAGHGPLLLYRFATNKIETLEAQGIPLGMIAGARYEQATEGSLAEGDFMALVTDGFYEWANPEGEEFGVPRLEAVLHESHDLPAEEVIARLRSAVADFCKGTEQMDDLTAVVLKRKRESDSSEPRVVATGPLDI